MWENWSVMRIAQGNKDLCSWDVWNWKVFLDQAITIRIIWLQTSTYEKALPTSLQSAVSYLDYPCISLPPIWSLNKNPPTSQSASFSNKVVFLASAPLSQHNWSAVLWAARPGSVNSNTNIYVQSNTELWFNEQRKHCTQWKNMHSS